MPQRTGRPTSAPKGNYTGIRLSDDEVRKLDYCMKETGLSKTDVIREGIDAVYLRLERINERRCGMYSFKDVRGNIIPFENKTQLHLELQTDIVSGEVTAYLVQLEDDIYQVDKKTYDAIDEM